MDDIILDKETEEEIDSIVQGWAEEAERIKQQDKKSKYQEAKEKLK